LTIADDNHRGEAESASAFDNGRTAFDLHHAIEQAVIFRFLTLLSATTPILIASATNCSDPRLAAQDLVGKLNSFW
jgi:hypothetical protein